MTKVLDWCPIGVINAQEAETATTIRNGSKDALKPEANDRATGAMITAAAALLITFDSAWVITNSKARAITGDAP